MKTVYYIAGKISGKENYKEVFEKAENRLIESGAVALNPAKLPQGMESEKYMPICFAMIDAADCVYMLSNWQDSAGAKIEHAYATYQHKKIVYERAVVDSLPNGGGERE